MEDAAQSLDPAEPAPHRPHAFWRVLHGIEDALLGFALGGILLMPLMEIVTEADLHSADEAYAYVTKLRQLVRYLGISTGDMDAWTWKWLGSQHWYLQIS